MRLGLGRALCYPGRNVRAAVNPALRFCIPGTNATAALQPMIRHMHEDPAGFLQHAICVHRDLDMTLSISWGRSVKLYSGTENVAELLTPGDGEQLVGFEALPSDACCFAILCAAWVGKLLGLETRQVWVTDVHALQSRSDIDGCCAFGVLPT